MVPPFSLWLLLASPLIARSVISQVPPVARLATLNGRITLAVGLAGLALLYAGALGALPAGPRVPLMLLGGIAGGWSTLWTSRRRSDGGGEDWRHRSPPDDPPQGPWGYKEPDWELFDRVRAEWEKDLAGSA